MTDVFLNARQQDILQKLMQAEWTPHPRLVPAGDSVSCGLVNKGWIESCQQMMVPPVIGSPKRACSHSIFPYLEDYCRRHGCSS